EFLMQILEGIHKYLPNIKHVTTYARADSIARKSVSELRELKTAGIEHLYCGMETGSDLILRKINKGFDAATIIISGTKAKEAGMVLSEFTLFGIGGKELAEENAVETAKVLNVIKPDFVRVHATGIKLSSEMWNYVKNKELTLQSEEEIVSEQKIMLELLADDMDCIYMNEHIVNLLLEVRGNIRTDKQNMLETINTYLQLPKQEQELFNLGRRLNIMFFLADLNNRAKRKQTEEGLRKIKTQNPDLDLAFVCNYVRQTQI
ncbi:radical SAM protein, partial [Holdemanella sp.]